METIGPRGPLRRGFECPVLFAFNVDRGANLNRRAQTRSVPSRRAILKAAPAAAADTQYFDVKVHSDSLSAFWGQPVAIEAHILLPDSYYKDLTKRYPVLYWIQGFDGYGDPDFLEKLSWQKAMRVLHSEFILVFLNGMFNGGHQEFADSANNGPWHRTNYGVHPQDRNLVSSD